ncbi:UvrD-helicase domain-containing protein [Neobacillus sp. CF12]|uniref:UvrD-helicase domain-containing protein n=1 Tax=Neobacillus sp. CF12 TaxID=3055864 RepID=UPI0025A0FAED|nr:UvrD-helicase domain-containing protein [Neobacillus sp. CF12]MDM5326844.1 UvrD-helicase domain-containing protein [Neobacillus sp. CF12]
MGTAPEYSLALFADVSEIQYEVHTLCSYMNTGVKIVLFTNSESVRETAEFQMKEYQKAKLLQIFVNEELEIHKKIEVFDGDNLEQVEEIALRYHQFNFHQYKIEHAPLNENIMVKAGAGTGKTTVMIDRILYLLIKGKLDPAEIAMITFTREAARNMYKKLRGELFARFNVTGVKEYIQWIEKLNNMRIQTIHSFAKSLLREIGSLRGYGLNVRLRSFTMEKRSWIEEELDTYFQSELESAQGNIESILSPLKMYELIDVIYDFWEKFEQKGFTSNEILNANFGPAAEGHEKMNELLKTVIKNVEKRFTQAKVTENSLSLSDLSREMDHIQEQYGKDAFKNVSSKISYLFVDEFQDSDDIQIRLFVTIQEAFSSKLFVVGDIKQSIYRFRGANHTAFEEIKELLKQRNVGINDQDYYLQKNYRTGKTLLERMNPYFSWWGQKKYLTYQTVEKNSDKLVGMFESDLDDPLTIDNKKEEQKEQMKRSIMPEIREAFNRVKGMNSKKEQSGEKEKFAVLTRTIDEARMIQAWCKEADLLTKLEVGGGFYRSKPVRDFHSLILGLLYPNDARFVSNLVYGPYGKAPFTLYGLISKKGYSLEKLEVIKSQSSFDFEKYQKQLKVLPVLSVLRRILEQRKPAQWIYSRRLDDLKESQGDNTDEQLQQEASLYAQQYDLNMGKLFEKMHQSFSEEFVSLAQIEKWLQVNIATNRDEEEVIHDVEDVLDYVHITTVHRSKGLEYYTVLIPFTERIFTPPFSKIIFNKEKTKVGWLIQKQNAGMKSNDFYDELYKHENLEAIQEETRLLYVAMTRAKQQLIIHRNRKNDHYNWTWSRLLSAERGE